ncbi:chemotaxis protein CheW [Maridesulfovibrio ferrireducens]|uniref:chemotaxis protein CheW n=1 Tax=Maridesulfovibrio ferrireducens TaxID=246191 RepID=UPI001A22308D|nr:chemotaxis protein CheW [Maridesulfovibrio ferrireducens]MBI9112863.1 purine-binding chemotaxis protein CheW [Maridesulfovibrio ferrireducens]
MKKNKNALELLNERAIKLARKITLAELETDTNRSGNSRDYVQFNLGSDAYAFDTSIVKEVLEPEEIVAVPCTPDFIKGIVSVRGHICPVIDLCSFLGLPGRDNRVDEVSGNKVLFLSSSEMGFGVLIDEITDVFSVLDEEIKPLSVGSAASDRFSVGIINERIVVLDGSKILIDPALIVNEVVGGSISNR